MGLGAWCSRVVVVNTGVSSDRGLPYPSGTPGAGGGVSSIRSLAGRTMQRYSTSTGGVGETPSPSGVANAPMTVSHCGPGLRCFEAVCRRRRAAGVALPSRSNTPTRLVMACSTSTVGSIPGARYSHQRRLREIHTWRFFVMSAALVGGLPLGGTTG